MPTYLYRCQHCGEFEADHSIKEQLTECPQCKAANRTSEPPTRLISSCSFVLGSGGVGWARDNYSK
jgi:putative FmdB family regulatory protein